MGKAEEFAKLGVKLQNSQWSWSGKSDDGDTVALTLWRHKITNGGKFYCDDVKEIAQLNLGAKYRIEHLKYAKEKLGGRFKAVIAVAKDEAAELLLAKRYYAWQGVEWRIEDFDESTGSFTAWGTQ